MVYIITTYKLMVRLDWYIYDIIPKVNGRSTIHPAHAPNLENTLHLNLVLTHTYMNSVSLAGKSYDHLRRAAQNQLGVCLAYQRLQSNRGVSKWKTNAYRLAEKRRCGRRFSSSQERTLAC